MLAVSAESAVIVLSKACPSVGSAAFVDAF